MVLYIYFCVKKLHPSENLPIRRVLVANKRVGGGFVSGIHPNKRQEDFVARWAHDVKSRQRDRKRKAGKRKGSAVLQRILC